jgi:hypothetical protein
MADVREEVVALRRLVEELQQQLKELTDKYENHRHGYDVDADAPSCGYQHQTGRPDAP